MIMNAFPPMVDELNGEETELFTARGEPGIDLEDYYIKFLAVADGHLAAATDSGGRWGKAASLPFMSLFRRSKK